MSRSVKKGPFVQEALYKRIVDMNKTGAKQVLKTWSRSSTIFPEFVGHTIAVHDGRKHVPVYVTEDMVARKLGMHVFLLTDCLINKEGRDISAYPQGSFEQLLDYVKKETAKQK